MSCLHPFASAIVSLSPPHICHSSSSLPLNHSVLCTLSLISLFTNGLLSPSHAVHSLIYHALFSLRPPLYFLALCTLVIRSPLFHCLLVLYLSSLVLQLPLCCLVLPHISCIPMYHCVTWSSMHLYSFFIRHCILDPPSTCQPSSHSPLYPWVFRTPVILYSDLSFISLSTIISFSHPYSCH